MAPIRTDASSRELDQDLVGAERMAEVGPVVAADQGRPAFVLVTHETYETLGKKKPALIDIIADPNPGADFIFRCAALHVPDRRPYNDALIGATALVRGHKLVTPHVDDFAGLGPTISNPWETV
jgi:hypothetical protein